MKRARRGREVRPGEANAAIGDLVSETEWVGSLAEALKETVDNNNRGGVGK